MAVDVLTMGVVPFLQMRDYKSLRVCSKDLRTKLIRGDDNRVLNTYICRYLGCPNRAFIYNAIDPFMDYLPRLNGSLFRESLFSICLFPVYIVPFYSILYYLVKQEVYTEQTTADGETTATTLQNVLGSYMQRSERVQKLTGLPSMDMHCVCIDTLETLAQTTRCKTVCRHATSSPRCTRLVSGGCVAC